MKCPWLTCRSVLWLAAALAAGISALAAPPPEEPSPQAMHVIYERAMADIQRTYESATREQTYAAALARANDGAKKRGDFEGAMALQQEIERYKKDPVIPDELAGGAHALIAAARTAYREGLARAQADRDKRIVTLTCDQYLRRLESLRAALTQQNKLEAAVAVDREMKAVADAPAVKAAQFALAAHAADQPPPQPPTQGDGTDSATNKPGERTFTSRRSINAQGSMTGGPTITAVRVEPGDVVTVRASGVWTCSGQASTCGPDGYFYGHSSVTKDSAHGTTAYQTKSYMLNDTRAQDGSKPYGALLVRVGQNDAWQVVGDKLSFTAESKGPLTFDANVVTSRETRRGCTGAINVDIDVRRTAAPPK